MKTKSRWCVLVSGEEAKLVRITPVNDRDHLEEVDSLANQWQPPRLEPPTSLSTPQSEHSYGSIGHFFEEHDRQYTRYVAEWIERVIAQHALDEVFVFAVPRLHGWLRKAYSLQTARHIRECHGDFAHGDLSQLRRHPPVAKSAAPVT